MRILVLKKPNLYIFHIFFIFTKERSYVDPLTSVEERSVNRRRNGVVSLDEYERRGDGSLRSMGIKNVPRGPPYNSIYPDTRGRDEIRSSSNEMYEVRRPPLGIGVTVLYIIYPYY